MLVGSTGCNSAETADDGSSSAAAAASESGKSATLAAAGDSFTFDLTNVDAQHTMILSIKGPGVHPMAGVRRQTTQRSQTINVRRT